MKKIFTLFISIVMVIIMAVPAFAADNTLEITAGTNVSQVIERDASTVQPKSVDVLYDFNSPFWPSFEGSFHLDATRNLKIIFKASSDCTISFYKGNWVIPFKTLNLPGGVDLATYDIKNNCGSGDYSFIITTNDSSCQAVFRIVSTEYI